MLTLDWIGHFHPLLVHLPIGILLFAAVLMVFGRWRGVDTEAAVTLAWGLGALSAGLACATGWWLARSGEYEADAVETHQWLGLATAGLSALTYFVRRYRWIPATATVVLLTGAGHYGGNLTHGEDYLFPKPAPLADKEPVAVPSPTAPGASQTRAVAAMEPTVRRTFPYRDQVQPILETNCYSCHSARKKKGGLRLDTEAFIRQGGKNGRVLTAGYPQQSKLFSYLLLPLDDDNHMPPKGKRQLSREEITILHQWIARGASFEELVETLAPATDLAARPATPLPPPPPLDLVPATVAPEPVETGAEARVLARPVEAPAPPLLEKLRKQQITLTPLGDGSHLSANFVNLNTFQPTVLADLEALRTQLVRLRLANQPIDDETTRRLATFRNLTRLNLENTRITDEALTHLKELPNLEQLNLYGTAITDAGLATLARYPSLKVVYLWQTQTTPAGIERLRQARPGLKIDTGGQQLTRPDTAKTPKATP